MKSYEQIAYETYCTSVNASPPHLNLPSWDILRPETKEHWLAAVNAVIRSLNNLNQ